MSEEHHKEFLVAVWKTDPLEIFLEFPPASDLPLLDILVSNLKNVYLAFTEDGKYLAMCFAQRVKVLDAQTGVEFKSFTLPGGVRPMSLAVQ